MAKADLNKVETDWKHRVGRAVERIFKLAGVSAKEAAAAMDVDVAQVSRWCAGTERPQFDVMLSIDALRPWVVMALAEIGGEAVDVETIVRIRRTA